MTARHGTVYNDLLEWWGCLPDCGNAGREDLIGLALDAARAIDLLEEDPGGQHSRKIAALIAAAVCLELAGEIRLARALGKRVESLERETQNP